MALSNLSATTWALIEQAARLTIKWHEIELLGDCEDVQDFKWDLTLREDQQADRYDGYEARWTVATHGYRECASELALLLASVWTVAVHVAGDMHCLVWCYASGTVLVRVAPSL